MILSLDQAQAVYSAVHALSEAGGRLYVAAFDAFSADEALIDIRAYDDDRIEVSLSSGEEVEIYPDIYAFALAYGLPKQAAP